MNKRKLILSICLSVLITGGFNKVESNTDIDKRRDKLLSVIDEELKEVARLNKQLNASNPELMLRLAQVLLEKGRILRDAENQKFLDVPSKQRNQANRDQYFKDSQRYFDQAQKTVLVLLKKFKNFPEKGDAYYVLAFNAKEARQNAESIKYFNLALKNSKANSPVAEKSRSALAEIYFNQGSFDKAAPLYEQSLKGKKDKWWTKDALNLSRSYSKLGKHDQAIRLMNEAYELSKNSNFIDVTKDIERDIAVVYVNAGRIKDAVVFYEKNGKSVSDVLLKVGRYLKAQSKFADAENVLNDALKYKKNDKEEVEIQIELISLYEKFGRDTRHLQSSKFLAKQHSMGNLNEEQTDILRFNVDKMSALLQQQIVKQTYQRQPKILKEKMDAAVDYFMIKAQISPKDSGMAYMLAGETLFAAGEVDKAVPMYAEAIKKAQAFNDKKTEKAASDSIMNALSKNVNPKTIETYLIPAYEGFLSVNPRGDKSNAIYQRLFSAQMAKKQVPEAEKVLVNYKANFPKEDLVQEKMLAQIMDHHRSTGNKQALSSWADKVENKEFNVNPEYAGKVKSLMLGMQFEKVEEASKKGDKRGALRGYLEIYSSPETDTEAKKTAAYNISVLFFETGKWQQMHQWANRTTDLMSAQEVNKFENNFIHFTTDLFQRRKFDESAQLSEKIFDKICKTNSANKRVYFKNANVIYLAEKKFDKSLALMNKAQACSLADNDVLPGYVDHLNELANSNKWGSFNDVIKRLEASPKFWPQLIYPSSLLANELDNIGRVDDGNAIRKKIINYYNTSKKSKYSVPLEGLDVVAQLELDDLEAQYKKLSSMKLRFPEAEFNKMVKAKFDQVGRVTSAAMKIAEIGSGVGIVKAYKYSVMALEDLRDEINNFSPEGKSADYVTSFKKGMGKLTADLNSEATNFRNTAVTQIEKDNILSSDNSWFLVKNDGIIPEHISGKGNAIMDKAGAR